VDLRQGVFYQYDKAEMDEHIIRVSGGLARRPSGGFTSRFLEGLSAIFLEDLTAVFLAKMIPFTYII